MVFAKAITKYITIINYLIVLKNGSSCCSKL